MIKRALISVSDKTGVVDLAKELQSRGCEIVSTGGTKSALEKEGISVRDISSMTKNPEAFGGRVKTLSFQTSAALLFDRDKDVQEAKRLSVEPIDLVVCNCYPFEKVAQSSPEETALVENIDIGGPTMIRSAAKNFAHVTVVTDPRDYTILLDEMEKERGGVSLALRRKLMRKAFHYMADYDAAIATAMDRLDQVDSLRLSFTAGKPLRYGENAHQTALFYKEQGSSDALYDMDVLHGKQLSYNNLMDVNSAIDAVIDLKRVSCAVIKHNTPCGLAESDSQATALCLAWESDPVSAFGSVIAFNAEVQEETVRFFCLKDTDKSKRKFIEAVVAPGFSEEALEVLKQHKNLRVLRYAFPKAIERKELRYFKGSLLLQDRDEKLFEQFDCVTKKSFPEEKRELVAFGLKAVRQVRSNAIVVVRQKACGAFQLLGMGAGQPNRLTSVSLALDKCQENLKREGLTQQERERQVQEAVLISEAFFPFSDSVEHCARYGIKKIVQPGGSMRDSDVIQACDEEDISMVMTGIRHFKH